MFPRTPARHPPVTLVLDHQTSAKARAQEQTQGS